MAGANLKYRLLRTFYDLNPVADGPMANLAPLLAWERFYAGTDLPTAQRVFSGAFRANLQVESGLLCGVNSPVEVSPAFRSERWQQLCSATEAFDDLRAFNRVALASVWLRLGFYRLILKKVERSSPSQLGAQNDLESELSYLRAFARYMFYLGNPRYQPTDLEEIVDNTPNSSRAARSAAGLLMVYYGKLAPSPARVAKYRTLAENSLQRRCNSSSDFTYFLEASRFYRTASYLPFVEKRKEAVSRELRAAEDYGHLAIANATSEWERLASIENLHPITETRMREAAWIGDRDRELELVVKLVTLDPWDAKSRVEYGEALLRRNRYAEAATQFEKAAMFGPPGTVIALFLAGQCFEKIGHYTAAANSYLQALSLDPDGISTTAGLLRTSRSEKLSSCLDWARKNSDRIARGEHVTPAQKSHLAQLAAEGAEL